MQKHAVHLWLLEAKQCLQKVEKQEEERLAVNLVSCLPQKLSARTACNIMSQKSNHHHHCQIGTITVHLSSRCFTQGTFEENWSSQRRRSNTDARVDNKSLSDPLLPIVLYWLPQLWLPNWAKNGTKYFSAIHWVTHLLDFDRPMEEKGATLPRNRGYMF